MSESDNPNPSDNNLRDNSESNAEDSEAVTFSLNNIVDIENEIIEAGIEDAVTAAAVLGAANDKTCSYADGYVTRQPLYSCLTCVPEAREDPNKGAGICLACSYHCHDGHELVELYTKRNFRCDCGNSKFKGVKCNLNNNKEPLNENNVYNQNFAGVYCVCNRPYPDTEDPLPDEMIQCIICEDWYHSRHLGAEVPTNSYAEMICEACVDDHEFLLHYTDNKTETNEEEAVNVQDTSDEATATPKKCTKPEKKLPLETKFWSDISWRKDLCTCPECLEMYKKENVEFLIDPEDCVQHYEEKGKANAIQTVQDTEKKFMDSMDRVQLMEVIAGYNDLKENLVEYLKKFVENKKVVRVEDIKEFFDGMTARKKQKLSSVPHYCR